MLGLICLSIVGVAWSVPISCTTCLSNQPGSCDAACTRACASLGGGASLTCSEGGGSLNVECSCGGSGNGGGGGGGGGGGLCLEGCSVGACACLVPAFTCNPSAGHCVGPACDGLCQPAWWLILIIVLVILAIGVGVFFCARRCCCPTCCQRKQTVNHIYGALPQDHMLAEHASHPN